MGFSQAFKLAFKSLSGSKMRAFLTMLGIIIGVASVIAIVASIQGTTKLQRLQYEAMGANRIDVYAWGAKNKDWKDFEEYLDSLDEVAAWSPQSQYWDWQSDGVQYRSKKMDSNGSDSGYLQMYFVNEHYGECTSMSISAGRDISEADCKSRARVCVIGETLRKYFFGAMSPIGQNLRIGGKSFEIIGVYAGKYGGKLYLDGLADRAYVFVNKEYKGVIYRNDKKQCIDLHGLSGENDIDILVEAMGRVNYGPHLLDRKGVDQIRINYQVLSHWDIYTLPLDNIDKLRYTDTKGLDTPTFMRGTFKTTSRGDCFVHTAGLKKGYIFINGFCLGRYWDIGPQESLYIPGTILKDENEIVVLELENSLKTTVRIDDKHNIAGGKKKKFFFF